MIGIDDTEIEPMPETAQGFGDVPDGFPMEVMLVAQRDGEWVFEREIGATYLLQAKRYEWSAGKVARWNRLAVRVGNEEGITTQHELVVAAYPVSRRWHQALPFKTKNRKGGALEKVFDSEGAMHEWLESLPYDPWETGNYVTAGISRPELIESIGNSSRGRKTFGAVAGCVETAVTELFSHPKLREALGAASGGKLACAPTPARQAGVDAEIFLHSEVRDDATSYMGEAIFRALAGPVSDDSAYCVGKPVSEMADQIFREIVYAENRRLLARVGGRNAADP